MQSTKTANRFSIRTAFLPSPRVPTQPFDRATEERNSRKASQKRSSRSPRGGADALGDGGLEADARPDAEEDPDGAGAAAAAGVDPGTSSVIPGSHISILPSFMDELKTRASLPVRTVVEPALAAYTAVGVGRKGRGKEGPPASKPRVGVEPVYRFRL